MASGPGNRPIWRLLALIGVAVVGLGILMLIGLLGRTAGGGVIPAADDRLVTQGDVVIAPGERVHNVTTTDGDISVRAGAVVTGDVTAQSGDVVIEGRVGGNVSSLSGDVTLAPTAYVGGSVLASAGDIYRQRGATVEGSLAATTGQVHNDAASAAPPRPGSGSGFFGWLVRLILTGVGSLVVLVLGVVVLVVAPRPVTRIEATLEEVFWPSAVVGVLTAILLPIVTIILSGILLFTVVGAPLVLLVAGAVWFLGLVVFALWLGERLARIFPRARLARTAVGRGTLGLAAILAGGVLVGSAAQWLGAPLVYLLGCFGLGAVILSRGGSIALVRDSHLPFGLSRITGPLGGGDASAERKVS
jgi:cytoskeletal protein CcmA (bactofilin family)